MEYMPEYIVQLAVFFERNIILFCRVITSISFRGKLLRALHRGCGII